MFVGNTNNLKKLFFIISSKLFLIISSKGGSAIKFNLFKTIEFDYLKKWVILGVLIGIVAGVGAIVFFSGLKYGTIYFLGSGAGFFPPAEGAGLEESLNWAAPANLWLIPIVITLGGLVSGFLVYTFAPEAEGHGTDAAIRAFHREKGVIRKRIPLIKMVTSIITISTGGSAGREGPIAQIAAGFGSIIGSVFKLSERDRRLCVTVGMGAGIGAIFKAPLGGALIATELLYMRDFEKEALIPAIIASITGFSIFAAFEGYDPVFYATTYSWTLSQVPFYIVLGVACALIGLLYIFLFYKTHDVLSKIFIRLRIPFHFKPAAGAFMVGILVVFLATLIPDVGGAAGLGALSMGYGFVSLAMFNQLPIKVMFVLIFAKILTTSLTIGSGGSGGVFAPGLVIGAMIGGTIGSISSVFFPSIVPVSALPAFVIVGMMAHFGGISKTPIATIIMVSEMTQGFTLLFPAMVAVTTSYLLTGNKSIYLEQVATRLESPAHKDEYICELLKGTSVRSIMRKDFSIVTPEVNAKAAIIFMKRGVNVLPVIDEVRLVGCIRRRDIVNISGEWEKTLVRDIIKSPPLINPDDSLFHAIKKMDETECEALFMTDEENPDKLLGIILRRDIIKIY